MWSTRVQVGKVITVGKVVSAKCNHPKTVTVCILSRCIPFSGVVPGCQEFIFEVTLWLLCNREPSR